MFSVQAFQLDCLRYGHILSKTKAVIGQSRVLYFNSPFTSTGLHSDSYDQLPCFFLLLSRTGQ